MRGHPFLLGFRTRVIRETLQAVRTLVGRIIREPMRVADHQRAPQMGVVCVKEENFSSLSIRKAIVENAV